MPAPAGGGLRPVMFFALASVALAAPAGGPRLRRPLAFLQEERDAQPLISAQSPENIMNVLDYKLTQATPMPAAFDGMYCRGGACQYRVPPPPPTISPTPIVPVIYPRSSQEFCRGLTCLPGMGTPADTGAAGFMVNCLHLYNHVGGGLHGKPGHRTLSDAKESFFRWCKGKFAPPLWGACNGLGDLLVMAMRGNAGAADIGGTENICYPVYLFIGLSRQAAIDLRLLRETLPKIPALVQETLKRRKRFLPSFLAVGGGDLGPASPRGQAWRAYMQRQGYDGKTWSGPGFVDRVDDNQMVPGMEFLQAKQKLVLRREGVVLRTAARQGGAAQQGGAAKQPHPIDNVQPGEDRAFLPDYNNNPPCLHGFQQPMPKVSLAPVIPPPEIEQDLLEFCSGTFAEIMLGFAQYGHMVVQMTGDWCSWQSAVTNWVGTSEGSTGPGHPDWDFRRCQGMQDFVSYALRNDLDAGLGPGDVCRKLYLTLGDVEWHANAVKNAWVGPALRSSPAAALSTAADDDGMKELMKQAAEYADSVFSKLTDQRDMYNDLNGVKMDESSFSLAHKPPPPPPPPLPSSDDFPELS